MNLIDPEMFDPPRGPCDACKLKLEKFQEELREVMIGREVEVPMLCYPCHEQLAKAMRAARQVERFLDPMPGSYEITPFGPEEEA